MKWAHISVRPFCYSVALTLNQHFQYCRCVHSVHNAVVIHVAGSVAELTEHCYIIALFIDVRKYYLAVRAELSAGEKRHLSVNVLVGVRKLACVCCLECDFKTCGNDRIVNLELRSLGAAQTVGFRSCCL